MALINNIRVMANKAIGKIPALASQAKSYYSSPAMLGARSLASRLANAPGVKSSAITGAIGGAAIGGGYDYATNSRSNVGSTAMAGIRGGLMGAIGGAGYTYGKAAMGLARSKGITAASMMAGARSRMSSVGAKARGWMGR